MYRNKKLSIIATIAAMLVTVVALIALFTLSGATDISMYGAEQDESLQVANAATYINPSAMIAPSKGYTNMQMYYTGSSATVISSGENYDNLFDGDTGTKYCYGGTSTVTINYSCSFVLRAYALASGNDTGDYPLRNAKNITVKGSNNGTDWTTISVLDNSAQNKLTTSNKTYNYIYVYDSTVAYSKYQFIFTNDSTTQFSELVLYSQLKTSYYLTSATSSTTTPAGETVENLFDGNTGSKMFSAAPCTLTLAYSRAFVLRYYLFATANDSTPDRNPRTWYIYGSHDNSNWNELAYMSNTGGSEQMPSTTFTAKGFDVSGIGVAYEYYKLVFANTDAGCIQLSELGLYEYSYDYNDYTTADGNYVSRAVTSHSIDTDGGATSERRGNLFDNNTGTKLCYGAGTNNLYFQFSSPIILGAYSWVTANDTAIATTRNFTKWTLYGSSDNSSWNAITTVDNSSRRYLTTGNYNENYFTIPYNVTAYRYYKMYLYNDSSVSQMSELYLFSKTVDTAAPSNTVTMDRTLDYYYNSVSLTFNAADSGSGFWKYQYKLDSGSWTNFYLNTLTAEAPSSGTTTKTVYVRAYDALGNYSEKSFTLNFDRNTYSITYNCGLDGANNASNPLSYNVETPTITFGSPTRQGFGFNGWYKESNYATVTTGVPKQSQGNIVVYAKYTLNALATPSGSGAVNKSYDAETVTITCTPTHAAVTKSFTYQWYKGGGAIQNATAASYNVKNAADSGNYTCSVTVLSDGQSSTATTATIVVSISKRAVTVTANAINKTYGEVLVNNYTYQTSNVVGGESLTGTLSCTPIQAADTYPITQGSITNENNSNYNITFNGANYTIAKYALTVTATPISKTYGGDLLTSFAYTITKGTLQNKDTALNGALTCPTLKQAFGDYEITQGSLTNDNNSNYDINYVSANYSIAKYDLSVDIDDKSSVYGDDLATLTSGLSDGNTLTNGDKYSALGIVLTKAEGLSVDTYSITATYTNNNYDISFNNGTYTITVRPIEVTATAINKTYGDTLVTSYSYSTTNLVEEDELSGALACPTLTQAYGAYPITQGTLTNANNKNYDITFTGANYSIAKYALTVTATAIDKVYGEALLTSFDYTITEGTLQNNDTALVGTLECTPVQAYGKYPITQGTLTNDNNANYNITFEGANYNVAKYALTVTATAVNKIYGEELLTSFGYTITIGELQNEDTALVGTLECTPAQAYGKYPITQGTLTNENNVNYAITYIGADYNIGKSALTVTATAINKVYGEELLATFAYTITKGSLQDGDSALIGDLACPTLTQAYGDYPITQGSLTNENNANYNITFEGANYSIAKYALTVTATAVNKTYGEELLTSFGYTITIGELQNNDTALNGALACPTLKQAYGDYPITQGSLTNENNVNYAITFNGANYSIAKYALTITATAINKTYGDDLLTSFAYTITAGELQNNDIAFVGALACPTLTQAYGTYPITQGSLTNDNNTNYNITFNGADYSIAKYALTVTATAINKTYGEELLATFAYTITAGELQNNDTALVGALACPTLTQAYGTYPITQGTLTNENNVNYAITFNGADYSIAKKDITGATVTLGAALTYNGEEQTQTVTSWTIVKQMDTLL